MGTNRVEAFSDGVIAVIITIMVLELKVPHEATVEALEALLPSCLNYAISFLVVAIMWVNHHHLLHSARHAEVALLWSNNNLLFWMSLIPFVTAYMSETHGAAIAVAAYGAVLTVTSFGFYLLQGVLGCQNSDDEAQRTHYRRLRRKTVLAILLYVAATGLAFAAVWISFAIFVLIPLLYFWPESRSVTASAK